MVPEVRLLRYLLAAALHYYRPGSISLEVTSIVAQGEHVAVEWTSRALPAAGELYENFCIGVFIVRDGRIQGARVHGHAVRAQRSAETARAVIVLGVVSPR
jgi:ketosteroid isomerase-like protein